MKRLAVTMFIAAVLASIILAVGWIALWFDAFRDWDRGWAKPLDAVDPPAPLYGSSEEWDYAHSEFIRTGLWIAPVAWSSCQSCLGEFLATSVESLRPDGWRWEDCMGDFCG